MGATYTHYCGHSKQVGYWYYTVSESNINVNR